jgi:hypothetical protein
MRRAEKAAGCHILFARCLALNNPIAQSLNQLRAEGLAHANTLRYPAVTCPVVNGQ